MEGNNERPMIITRTTKSFHEGITWILHESEVFIGKASKGEDVVFYFEPLVTRHMKASGSPKGEKFKR